MLPFFHNYLHAKDLRYSLIPSRYIDDQRILQSDWAKSTTGQTQLKVVISDAAFP